MQKKQKPLCRTFLAKKYCLISKHFMTLKCTTDSILMLPHRNFRPHFYPQFQHHCNTHILQTCDGPKTTFRKTQISTTMLGTKDNTGTFVFCFSQKKKNINTHNNTVPCYSKLDHPTKDCPCCQKKKGGGHISRYKTEHFQRILFCLQYI